MTTIISYHTFLRILCEYFKRTRFSAFTPGNRRLWIKQYFRMYTAHTYYIEPGVGIGINDDGQFYIYGVDVNQDINKYLK